MGLLTSTYDALLQKQEECRVRRAGIENRGVGLSHPDLEHLRRAPFPPSEELAEG